MQLSPHAAVAVTEQLANMNLLIVWYEDGIWHPGGHGERGGYEGRDTWGTRLDTRQPITKDEIVANNQMVKKLIQEDIDEGHSAFIIGVRFVDKNGLVVLCNRTISNMDNCRIPDDSVQYLRKMSYCYWMNVLIVDVEEILNKSLSKKINSIQRGEDIPGQLNRAIPGLDNARSMTECQKRH